MKKILTSLRNFAHLTSVHGYERIGITTNEIKGITASMAFEVPARPADVPGKAGADGEQLPEQCGNEAGAWVKSFVSPSGQGTPAKPFAILN